nr:TonB-dependent receptor [Paludibacteraceae bacterium]
MNTKEDIVNDGFGYIARPMDQLYNISIFFQDFVPRFPQYRVHLLFNWSQGFPLNSARGQRFFSKARMPDYRRVDIGASRIFDKKEDAWMIKGVFKSIERMQIAVEVLNLFGFYNVNSYYWVSDVFNQQHAVPNYLTGTQLNIKLQIDF